MQEFLQIILNLPTVVFTILLGVISLYWVTVIVGVLDIDLFDMDADIDADIDMDVDVDVDMDADIDADADVDVDGVSGVVSVLDALGLVGVPLTISLSLFTFFNWCATFLGSYALGAGQAALSPVKATGVLAGSIALSLLMTSLSVKPLRPLFRSKAGAKVGQTIVGHTVKIISGSVDMRHGRAEMPLEGSTLNLSVRCERPDNGLARGAEALVIAYDAAQHIYLVEPMQSMLGASSATEQGASSGSKVSLEDAFKELEEQQQSAASKQNNNS